MKETQLIQGRLISPEDIAQIRALMIENPKWHRTRLSIEICRLWNWIDATGRRKDMACRTLLLKQDQTPAMGIALHHKRRRCSKAVHARSNEPARYRCHSKVIRATDPELAVQLVGDAYPTRLRMAPGWSAQEAQS